MEEEASHSQSKPTTGTTERKHAAMLERLLRLHESRHNSKSNPSDSSSNAPSFESTQSFLSNFSNSKLSIEFRLSLIPKSPDPKSDLDNISISISELEKIVAQNSYFLPSYELRSSLKSISDLKQTLDVITFQVIPKKKFSFKSKRATANKFPVNSTQIDNQNIQNVEVTEQVTFTKVYDSPGFKGKANEVLVKNFRDCEDEIREFMLSDLTNCEVKVMGCLRSLFVHKLVNCRIYIGPVLGSILIEEVEGCVFVLASHQIRIHHAKASDFYLRVRSRPIIEDSSRVRFAPYCLCYDGIEKDLKKTNLDEETGNWVNVDDFRWLRAVQSPNWSVLPESERIDTMRILNSEA